MPSLALLEVIIPNALEYIYEAPQLQTPIQLYKNLLDRLNLTYLVLEIRKPDFEERDFIVYPSIIAFKISKTIVFVANIDTAGQLEIYLQCWLFLTL